MPGVELYPVRSPRGRWIVTNGPKPNSRAPWGTRRRSMRQVRRPSVLALALGKLITRNTDWNRAAVKEH